MGLIQDTIRKIKERKENQEGYARQKHIEESFAEKKKSSNERELERFREEYRQKRIKREVERLRKIENDKTWSGKTGNPVYAKNVIAGQKKIFSGDNMFAHCPSVTNVQNVTKVPYILGGKGK